jgi:formylmethanofuran dehydrogenase subunit E
MCLYLRQAALAAEVKMDFPALSGKLYQAMLSLDSLIREAESAHGHLCAGQILGVRLALFGLAKLGIDDPRGKDRKRLVTFVEIDRCATDAIGVVTGCRLGKRALKFRDWGKMAATFVDLNAPWRGARIAVEGSLSESSGFAGSIFEGDGLQAVRKASDKLDGALAPERSNQQLQQPSHHYKAIRVAARESSKQRARELYPEIENKNQQQMKAYREMPDDELFTAEWVKVELLPEEFPGYKAERIVCSRCGEGINFHREILRDGTTLCRSCAGESYYSLL